MAWASLFWTWTWAMSGLVPGCSVTVMLIEPSDPLVEEKYSRWSIPVSCCSMTWVTEDSAVSASAPG